MRIFISILKEKETYVCVCENIFKHFFFFIINFTKNGVKIKFEISYKNASFKSLMYLYIEIYALFMVFVNSRLLYESM